MSCRKMLSQKTETGIQPVELRSRQRRAALPASWAPILKEVFRTTINKPIPEETSTTRLTKCKILNNTRTLILLDSCRK